MKVEDEDKIRKALLKKALGYNASEVTEEYARFIVGLSYEYRKELKQMFKETFA